MESQIITLFNDLKIQIKNINHKSADSLSKAAHIISEWIKSGQATQPFPCEIKSQLESLPKIKIDYQSIEIDGNDVIFRSILESLPVIKINDPPLVINRNDSTLNQEGKFEFLTTEIPIWLHVGSQIRIIDNIDLWRFSRKIKQAQSEQIKESWLASKAKLYSAINEITMAVSRGDKPSVSEKLTGSGDVVVDFNSMKVVNREVIFKVQLKDNIGSRNDIWVRSGTMKSDFKTLEEKLIDELRELSTTPHK